MSTVVVALVFLGLIIMISVIWSYVIIERDNGRDPLNDAANKVKRWRKRKYTVAPS